MLECVTFTQMVKLVVKVFVNLSRGSVSDQKASENAETTHPHDLTVNTPHFSQLFNT